MRARLLLVATAVAACTSLAGLEQLSFDAGGGGASTEESGGGGTSTAAPISGGGGATQDQLSFTDNVDNGGFAQGTLDDVVIGQDHLTTLSASGTFTSQVFDTGVEDAVWTTLAYITPLNYGVRLPDGGEVETFARPADMSETVLLLHFDESGVLAPGATVADASGRGNDMTVDPGGASISLIDGVSGNALDDNNNTRLTRSVSQGSDFEFSESDFTWMAWVRYDSDYDCATNRAIIGLEDPPDGIHMWMGCAEPDSDCVPSGGPFGGGTWRANHGNGDGVTFCGQSTVNEGSWWHMVATKRGHPQATIRFYLNGVEEDIEPHGYGEAFAFSGPVELNIGAWNSGKNSAATLDEVAILLRAVDNTEVSNLYERLSAQVELRVRACSAAACSGVPFIGPDGTRNSHYVNAPGVLAPNIPIALADGVVGRYLQYQVVMKGNTMPELNQVTVTATNP